LWAAARVEQGDANDPRSSRQKRPPGHRDWVRHV